MIYKFSLQLTVFSVTISSLNAKDQGKEVAVQVIWPKGSNNKKETSNVTEDSLNSVLSKIRSEVIDDNCPEGINCTGDTMTGALGKVLGILATRLGKSGGIGYQSVKKSEITQQKFKLKLDGNSFKLKDEEDRQLVSDKNRNDEETEKYNNDNIKETEIQNLNPTENYNAYNENDDEMEQNSEEIGPPTNGVEYFVVGGNKIFAIQ